MMMSARAPVGVRRVTAPRRVRGANCTVFAVAAQPGACRLAAFDAAGRAAPDTPPACVRAVAAAADARRRRPAPCFPGRPLVATDVAKRALRLGIPSKGRMAELTLELLNVRACGPTAAQCGEPWLTHLCSAFRRAGLPDDRAQSERAPVRRQHAERARPGLSEPPGWRNQTQRHTATRPRHGPALRPAHPAPAAAPHHAAGAALRAAAAAHRARCVARPPGAPSPQSQTLWPSLSHSVPPARRWTTWRSGSSAPAT